ncbi:hypothetical protein, partial [Nocardiopsis lucentensis]|uniref:hypothetical protein n=1 Tax=Nocardiopsis lucentensis TaxID=53441 RepID=UPI0019D37708
MNYLITTGWIESYGVRVDPDAVVSSVRPAPPDEVRDRFRERLTRDVRPFFRPGGVRIEGEDGRAYQLRLSSEDDWSPSTTAGDGPARAKFKGLDDIQEQAGNSASDSSGSVKRLGIQFSGHLLATGGTVPLPSLRANVGIGSSSWQHSGDTGETQLRTTEMTGKGVDYSADLRVVLSADGEHSAPGAVPRGVELTLMGGLAPRRDDLPDTITFPDPLAPRPRRTPAPTRVGGYLSNSHPISAVEVVHDGDTSAGTRTADQGIAEWIADRLGLSAPTRRSRRNPLRRLYTPGESALRTRWSQRRRARSRDAVTDLFGPESLVKHLPVLTGEAAVLGFHDSEGRPKAVTVWSYPLRMTKVPDIPKSFNIKHTDRFTRGSTSTANRNSGFSVRPGIGVMERLAGDVVRLELPIVEYQYSRETGSGRARQSAAWNARLFHSTDTVVYSVQRRVAVWVDGDTAPTLFDVTSMEAVTSHEALILNDPSANAPLPGAPALRDPFLSRPRLTHLGDSQVRAVTFPDGAEVRLDAGNRPVTVFGEYAHRLLRRIDARYPGLVLPHMALPGSSRPDRSHAGWNHRRNRDTAVANTIKVLNAVNLRSFRFRHGDWIGHGVEVTLTETKLLPWGNEAGEYRISVPDHISLWLTASVRAPVPGPQVSGSHTGSTSGASAGLRRRDNTSRTHALELRATATWRGTHTVDSGDVPLFSGGGGARLTGEHRSVDHRGSGRSVTAEDNVKDKSGTQQLFADVEFGAWIGPGDTLVPRSARIDQPKPRTSRDLFTDGRDRVRGRIELHAPRPGRSIPLDPPSPGAPGSLRRLPASRARDLFREGAPRLLTNVAPPAGGDDPPTITRTRAAEILVNTFHVVQVFDTTVNRDGDRPTNVLSHTFDELNRTLRDLPGTLESQPGAGEIIANHMSPQQFAATPALTSEFGSRLRFQTDRTIPPTRNRLTIATWYLPTRVESLAPRPSASVESSHTKESAIGTAKVSTRGLFFGIFGRGGLNTNTGASPGEAPPPTAVDPIIGPGAEARYHLLGRGDTTSATQSLRSRTEVKLAGPSLEFVTDGVIAQAFEHKHDFSLGLTIPRSPGESDHAAWLAPVARAQKGVVPALWAYMDGLVRDRIDWAPDGSPTIGSHAPPAAPRAPVRPMEGLADKGYQSRPLDPKEALDDLITALSAGGYELTRTSREDLVHQLSTHMSRDLDHVPPIRVRVRPTTAVHRDADSGGSSTRATGFSRTATLNISVRRGAARTRQFGGMMEFVERVVVVRSADKGTLELSGWSFSGLFEARAPVSGGTGSSAALRAGGDLVVRHQSGEEESNSESVSVERTYERVGFGPYAVVSTETTLTLTLEVGGHTYTGTGRSGAVETVQPIPYLPVGDGEGATAAPLPAPVAVPTDGGTDADTAPPERTTPDTTGDTAPGTDTAAAPGDGTSATDPVAAWTNRRASHGYTSLRGEGGTDAPVAVQGAGRGVFDAAVESAARDGGWRPGEGGRSAREYLDDVAGRDTGTNPISAVASELVLRGLAPEALQHTDGVQLSDVKGTTVNLKALVAPGRAAIVAVSGESRARDAEHGQHGSSSSRSQSSTNALDVTSQVMTTGRPDDRLRQSPAGADLASNARSGQGRSSSSRTGAVAKGPGTSRQFLVRVPASWLAWSGPAGSPTTRRHPVEVEASLTLWISEARAREWNLATDAPEIDRLAKAEAAFTKADAAYLDAR